MFFTTDNGPEGDGVKDRTRGSTGGLRGRKRAMYEGGIRVPGIVRWPGQIKAGTDSDVPVIGSDFFPTSATSSAIAVPSDRAIDGADVLPLFDGRRSRSSATQPLYWRLSMAPPRCTSRMRSGDWKILASNDLTKFELYNLKDDPKETTDLSKSQPEKFAELREQLINHDAAVLAEGPDWCADEVRSS